MIHVRLYDLGQKCLEQPDQNLHRGSTIFARAIAVNANPIDFNRLSSCQFLHETETVFP